MTPADITALLSRIGRRNPELMASRDAQLLVDAIIEEGRKLPAGKMPQAPTEIYP
jgi:hypothetical protein